MILPTKHLPAERALITIGAYVLRYLKEPQSVSRLWDAVKKEYNTNSFPITFDWFILSLDFLAMTGVIRFDNERIKRCES